MASGFDYRQYVRWARNLGLAEHEFSIWLKNFLLEQAQRVVRECQKRQRAVRAIDTGAMINSWVIGEQTGGTSKSGRATVTRDIAQSDITSIAMVGDNLEVTIGNSVDYASVIEYGQGSYQGKYILTLSMDTIYQAMPGRFESAWRQFLNDKGVI